MNPLRDQHIQSLDDAIKALGNPERARKEKAYLKSELTFYGVAIPKIRKAANLYYKQFPDLSRDVLIQTVAILWWCQVHEMRSLAIALLEKYNHSIDPSDLPLILDLVLDSHTWAYVDWLAVKVIGPLVARDPNGPAHLRQWVRHDNFWVRRTALLALLDPLRAGQADFALFEELAVPLLPEKNVFIRKAIGWVLREVSKKQPETTFAFLQAHHRKASPLTLREGAKYLSDSQRAAIGLKPAHTASPRR